MIVSLGKIEGFKLSLRNLCDRSRDSLLQLALAQTKIDDLSDSIAFSNPVTAFGTTPVTAVASVGHLVKDTGLDAIAWQVGRSILKGITAQTVNWINSGFKGKPAFLTNPEKFFQNQADLQLERILGNDLNLLCQPFAIQVRLALVKTYLQEARPPACTIDRMIRTWENWGQNLEKNRAWENWFQVTQIDANNPYGAGYQARDFINVKIQSNNNKINKDLDRGKGFLTFSRCKRYARQTAPTGQSPTAGTVRQQCVERVPLGQVVPLPDGGFANSGDCLRYKEVREDAMGNLIDTTDEVDEELENECQEREDVTPGSVIENQLEKVLGSSVSQLEIADEINEIASALMIQLTQRAINGAMGGLLGLGRRNPTESKPFLDRIQAEDTALSKVNANTTESSSAEDNEQLKNIDDANKNVPDFVAPKPDETAIDPALVRSVVDDEIKRADREFFQRTPVDPNQGTSSDL
jgi:hypothetical protein